MEGQSSALIGLRLDAGDETCTRPASLLPIAAAIDKALRGDWRTGALKAARGTGRVGDTVTLNAVVTSAEGVPLLDSEKVAAVPVFVPKLPFLATVRVVGRAVGPGSVVGARAAGRGRVNRGTQAGGALGGL